MAAGMQAKDETQLQEFRHFVTTHINIDDVARQHYVLLDGVLALPLNRTASRPRLDFSFWDDLESLRPWGVGFARPSFLFIGVVLDFMRFVGDGKHLLCRLRSRSGQAGSVDGMIFDCHSTKLGAFFETQGVGACLDVVAQVDCDHFGGQRRLRLRIIDAVLSQKRVIKNAHADEREH